MTRAADDSKILQSFRFAGQSRGAVKSLRGFKKAHHTVPDAANATTNAFLAKLASEELAEEAERLFQQARTLLQYKRKDLSLDLGAGNATLTAKDFVCEIAYTLAEEEPSEYVVERSLHSLKSGDFLRTGECDQLFAGMFSSVVFTLRKGAPVERVIDAIEGLDGKDGESSRLKVDYPSDCRHCVIHVEDVEAEVRFDGGELAMSFPRSAPPSELWDNFLAVRHAFALSKEQVLAALIGG